MSIMGKYKGEVRNIGPVKYLNVVTGQSDYTTMETILQIYEEYLASGEEKILKDIAYILDMSDIDINLVTAYSVEEMETKLEGMAILAGDYLKIIDPDLVYDIKTKFEKYRK